MEFLDYLAALDLFADTDDYLDVFGLESTVWIPTWSLGVDLKTPWSPFFFLALIDSYFDRLLEDIRDWLVLLIEFWADRQSFSYFLSLISLPMVSSLDI